MSNNLDEELIHFFLDSGFKEELINETIEMKLKSSELFETIEILSSVLEKVAEKETLKLSIETTNWDSIINMGEEETAMIQEVFQADKEITVDEFVKRFMSLVQEVNVDENGNLFDMNGKLIEHEMEPMIDLEGNVRDINGQIIGKVDQQGNVIDNNGMVIGRLADPNELKNMNDPNFGNGDTIDLLDSVFDDHFKDTIKKEPESMDDLLDEAYGEFNQVPKPQQKENKPKPQQENKPKPQKIDHNLKPRSINTEPNQSTEKPVKEKKKRKSKKKKRNLQIT